MRSGVFLLLMGFAFGQDMVVPMPFEGEPWHIYLVRLTLLLAVGLGVKIADRALDAYLDGKKRRFESGGDDSQ